MSGKSDREKRRQERIEAEQADAGSSRNRLIVGYAIASTVVLAIAAVIFILASGGDDDGAPEGDAHINLNTSIGSTNGVQPDNRAGTEPVAATTTDLAAAAKRAGCRLRLELTDEGAQHIAKGSDTPEYKTNPPTSGPHVEPPYQQADGAYAEMPAEIDIVHSLEHGRMEIQYAPDLPKADQLALKGLYETMYGATLLFPNDKMPYEVAATTWTNMLVCPTYKGAATLDAIRAFGKETWGKYGGEPVEAFTFTGPTPAEPAS
ncbi:MAG TPA: DUF3105 domain-containing protein [Solirubrobacterales bacterium]|nr:DUF3105 domain-containing protein [Solirubrobacterales bacterium]